jgi:hypothetical protein
MAAAGALARRPSSRRIGVGCSPARPTSRIKKVGAFLHEHGLDGGAQLLGKIGDCAHMPDLARLVTRLAPSYGGVGKWGRRQWIQDAADLSDLLRRQRRGRTAARAMDGSAPDRPT